LVCIATAWTKTTLVMVILSIITSGVVIITSGVVSIITSDFDYN